MKKQFVFGLALMLFMPCLLLSVYWTMQVTGVSQNAITASVTAHNTSTSDVTWTFGSPDWLQLKVDDEMCPIITVPVVIQITVPAMGTYTENTFYSWEGWLPPQLIPLGTHTVQAYRPSIYVGEEGWIPAGNQQIVTVNDTYHFMNFNFQVESVNQDSLVCLIIAQNNDIYPFTMLDNGGWVKEMLDGNQVNATCNYAAGFLNIPAGATYTRRMVYNPTEPIPLGLHQISFSFRDYQNLPNQVYTNQLSVYILPTGNVEEVNTLAPISVYPNPFRQDVSIRFNTKNSQPVSYKVYNINGQLVKQLSGYGNTDVIWDGTDHQNRRISKGVYLIRAELAGYHILKKVIKAD